MENSTAATRQYKEMDFSSYGQLNADPVVINQLITSYQNIFGEPDVWAENHSHEEVDQKLKKELEGDASLRIILDEEKDQLAGFCWGQLLNTDQIMASIQSIKFYQSLGEPDLQQTLQDIISDESVLYIHDLGVNQEYRGKVNLRQLIYPVLNNLATRTGTSKIFFWSIEGTCISRLDERAGIDIVMTHNDIQLFLGEIPRKGASD